MKTIPLETVKFAVELQSSVRRENDALVEEISDSRINWVEEAMKSIDSVADTIFEKRMALQVELNRLDKNLDSLEEAKNKLSMCINSEKIHHLPKDVEED